MSVYLVRLLMLICQVHCDLFYSVFANILKDFTQSHRIYIFCQFKANWIKLSCMRTLFNHLQLNTGYYQVKINYSLVLSESGIETIPN